MKNILLQKKINRRIRGKNLEASLSIAFFVFFIGISLAMSLVNQPVGRIPLINDNAAWAIALVALFMNLSISAASLINLKDSWRVGVVENHETALVKTGIYRFSRNPYFLSYLLMFAGYTVLLQNLILLCLSLVGAVFIHFMVRKEEKHLSRLHGDAYEEYKKSVARYLIY